MNFQRRYNQKEDELPTQLASVKILQPLEKIDSLRLEARPSNSIKLCDKWSGSWSWRLHKKKKQGFNLMVECLSYRKRLHTEQEEWNDNIEF